MSRRPRRSSITRGLPVLGAAALVLVTLTWPLVLTYSGFAGDWDHHLWLLWHQSTSLESSHVPSLFLNSSYSVFYPLYAFYGGTLYTVGGLLSLALGGAPVQAYILIYILDFTAAFGGWYWLGRMAGLGRWTALVPGLVFITSTYYIVVIYVQGDWPGFTGISMIALMLAAGLSVLRADRLRVAPALALALSSILFFGSHNITILLGLTTLALTGLAILACVPESRPSITRRSVARLAGIVVPSALVSAWYLLPTLAYHSSTRIGSEFRQSREALKTTVGLVSLTHLLTLSRTSGPGLPAPYYLGLSLPVLAIVWVLAGILVLPRASHNRSWLRILLICSAMAILITVLMTHAGLLAALPSQYALIQFGYRLEIYVLLSLCGAILAALVLARSGAARVRVWRWMALPVCIVSLGGAIQQISALPYPGRDRYVTLNYYGEVETGNNRDFQDVAQPVIPGHGLPNVTIPLEAVHDDQASFTTRQPPGTLIATNIGAGPNLVALTGASAAGVDSETGNMVLRIAPGAGQTITVRAASSLPVVLGRVLTLIGVAILVVELLLLPAARLLTRRSRAPAAAQRPA
jgi:uncharacterized membrane protein